MIPETVPIWVIPVGWVASGVLFTSLAHHHKKSLAWGVLGLAFPFLAFVGYPLSYAYDRTKEQSTNGA